MPGEQEDMPGLQDPPPPLQLDTQVTFFAHLAPLGFEPGTSLIYTSSDLIFIAFLFISSQLIFLKIFFRYKHYSKTQSHFFEIFFCLFVVFRYKCIFDRDILRRFFLPVQPI